MVIFCVENAFKMGYWRKDKRWIEVTGRRGKRRRKLLYDLKERRRYSQLKEEALDRTMWRARFGRGFGPVVRQTTKWMNECQINIGQKVKTVKFEGLTSILPKIEVFWNVTQNRLASSCGRLEGSLHLQCQANQRISWIP